MAPRTHEADRAVRRRRLALLAGAAGLAAVIVVVIVIIAGGGSDGGTPGKGEPAAGAAETNKLFDGLPQQATRLGKASAPVTLVEFADLQCPFCGEFALNVMPTLVQDYVRTGKLRIELREIPVLGPDSLKAASWAAAASRQNRLYQFADLFYRNQGTENSGYVTGEFLAKIATGASVAVSRARRVAETDSVQQALIRTTRAARGAGVTGTPSFFVGRRGGNLQPLPVRSLTPDTFTGPIESLIPAA